MWRELKLLISPFVHLLEEHIVSQMITLDCEIAGKINVYIERSYQVGNDLERRY